MKILDLKTNEPYRKVSSNAKICLEAEQRRRIGGWLSRVLVLDKATLYSYRTKGESGSLNGWAIGGAEVDVKRPRKDGRYIVLISRPHAYSIVFSLNSLHEQASFIHALSTSGATIMGLHGIMLLNEHRSLQDVPKKNIWDFENGDIEDDYVRIRNSKTRNVSKPPLSMPQLSSRMLDMEWRFDTTDNSAFNSSYAEDNRYSSPPLLDNFNEGQDLMTPSREALESLGKSTNGCSHSDREAVGWFNNEDGDSYTNLNKNGSEMRSEWQEFVNEGNNSILKAHSERNEGREKSSPFHGLMMDRDALEDGDLLGTKAFTETLMTKALPESIEKGVPLDPKTPRILLEYAAGESKDLIPDNFSCLEENLLYNSDPDVILSGVIGVADKVGADFTEKKVELRRGELAIYPVANEKGIPYSSNASDHVARITLEGLSICPFPGNKSHTLILRKGNRCVIVLQLETGLDIMNWMHLISDEVVKVTPIRKRNSLILYPTPVLRKGKTRSPSMAIQSIGKFRIETNGHVASNVSTEEELRKPKEKQSEKNSESIFKGLKRRLAIRRPSREMDKGSPSKLPAGDAIKQENANFESSTTDEPSTNTTNSIGNTSTKESEITNQPHAVNVLEKESSSSVTLQLPDSCRLTVDHPTDSAPARLNHTEPEDSPLKEFPEPTELSPDSADNDIYLNSLTKENHFVSKFLKDNFKASGKHYENEKYTRYKHFPNISGTNVKNIIQNYNDLSEAAQSGDKCKGRETKCSSPGRKADKDAEGSLVSDTITTQRFDRGTPTSSLKQPDRMILPSKSRSKEDSDEEDLEENSKISITWSVTAIRERFEILNSVSRMNVVGPKRSWDRNSISRRKETRNSIRLKKTLEGESRRASLRRSRITKRFVSRESSNEHESEVPEERKVNNGLGSVGGSDVKLDNVEVERNLLGRTETHSGEECKWNSNKSVILTRASGLRKLGICSPGSRSPSTTVGVGFTTAQSKADSNPRTTELRKEDEMIDNLNETFLAKRVLVAKELELAKLQDCFVLQEGTVWDIQSKLNSILPSSSNGSSEMSRDSENEALESIPKLESALFKAKADNDILEEKLLEAKNQVNAAKLNMNSRVRQTLQA